MSSLAARTRLDYVLLSLYPSSACTWLGCLCFGMLKSNNISQRITPCDWFSKRWSPKTICFLWVSLQLKGVHFSRGLQAPPIPSWSMPWASAQVGFTRMASLLPPEEVVKAVSAPRKSGRGSRELALFFTSPFGPIQSELRFEAMLQGENLGSPAP